MLQMVSFDIALNHYGPKAVQMLPIASLRIILDCLGDQGRPDARSNKFRCHFGSFRVTKEDHILQMVSFGIILVSI